MLITVPIVGIFNFMPFAIEMIAGCHLLGTTNSDILHYLHVTYLGTLGRFLFLYRQSKNPQKCLDMHMNAPKYEGLHFKPYLPSCTISQLASARNLSIFSIATHRSLVIIMRLTQFVMFAFFASDISVKPSIFRTRCIVVALMSSESNTRPVVWIKNIWN